MNFWGVILILFSVDAATQPNWRPHTYILRTFPSPRFCAMNCPLVWLITRRVLCGLCHHYIHTYNKNTTQQGEPQREVRLKFLPDYAREDYLWWYIQYIRLIIDVIHPSIHLFTPPSTVIQWYCSISYVECPLPFSWWGNGMCVCMYILHSQVFNVLWKREREREGERLERIWSPTSLHFHAPSGTSTDSSSHPI